MGTLGHPFALGPLRHRAGRAAFAHGPTPAMPPAGPAPLAAPPNLLTPAQAAFDTAAHVDGRGNWGVQGGRLVKTGGSANEARMALDTPTVADHPHVALADHAVTAGNLKLRLGGNGVTIGRGLAADWQNFEYMPAATNVAAYPRLEAKPTSDYAGSLGDLRLHDLAATDPTRVACDVVIVGGDSNSANGGFNHVTRANREIAYDPRIWYLPNVTENDVGCVRHMPFPCIEPVCATPGRGTSPVQAIASRLVAWSAARGRALLMLPIGDPGSGLMNTEEWRRVSTVPGSGGIGFQSMLDAVAAMRALGPAHEIVGCVWSLGVNDRTSIGYDLEGGWLDRMAEFVADVRAHVADVPMVLERVSEHHNPDDDGASAAMRLAQDRLDQDSGDARALPRFRVVTPPGDQGITDRHDPHYTAAGQYEKGRRDGDALLALLGG